MGVLVQDEQEDIKRLWELLRGFETFWNTDPTAIRSQIILTAVDHNLPKISNYATQAFSEYKTPSHYHRVAAFILLTTICPCFSVTVDGARLTDAVRRRWLFSRLNLLFLPVLFTTLQGPDRPIWPGWPPPTIVQQIVGFLQRVDASDVLSEKDFAHSMTGLAKDIVALSVIIQLWVEFGQHGNMGELDSAEVIAGLLTSE